MFQINDRVQLNDPRCTWHGKPGTIIEISNSHANPYRMQLDGDDYAFWYTPEQLLPIDAEPSASAQHVQQSSTQMDFDRGFGIGGLGRHVEEPIIPSVKTIERMQKLTDTDVICRRCGASMNFDGAMFTNGGGDVCDDCF